MGKNYPSNLIDQVQETLAGWEQITPALPTIGDITQANALSQLKASQDIDLQIAKLEAQLTDLRNQRDEINNGLWKMVKRIHAFVKGLFGDDSSEYEMVGGTRLSERKRPLRKPAAPDSH